jgi:hypothetical protein
MASPNAARWVAVCGFHQPFNPCSSRFVHRGKVLTEIQQSVHIPVAIAVSIQAVSSERGTVLDLVPPPGLQPAEQIPVLESVCKKIQRIDSDPCLIRIQCVQERFLDHPSAGSVVQKAALRRALQRLRASPVSGS